MTRRPNKQQCQVYRFYDKRGRLLYIGMSINAVRRMEEHRATKAWWLDVADVKVDMYPDRASAERAEREAIQRERPRWNVIHGTGRRKPLPVVKPKRVLHVDNVARLQRLDPSVITTLDDLATSYAAFIAEFGETSCRSEFWESFGRGAGYAPKLGTWTDTIDRLAGKNRYTSDLDKSMEDRAWLGSKAYWTVIRIVGETTEHCSGTCCQPMWTVS